MSATTYLDAQPPRRSLLPDAVLIFITMIWGGTFLAVQTALQWSGPYGFVALRFGAGALIALVLARRTIAGLTRAELRAGIVVGSVLFFSYSLQTLGLAHIASSKSAFLTALYVPLVPLFSWLLFRHRPALAAWVGVGVAFVGLLLLSDPRGLDFHFGIGEWLTLAAAAAIALEICLVGRYAGRCEPRRVTVVQLAVVSLLAATAMTVSGEPLPTPAPGLIACVAGLGFATAAIQMAMNWAQKTVPATCATIIFAMEPVWAGLVGWLAGETLTVLAISGAALIVASVLVSQLGARDTAAA